MLCDNSFCLKPTSYVEGGTDSNYDLELTSTTGTIQIYKFRYNRYIRKQVTIIISKNTVM